MIKKIIISLLVFIGAFSAGLAIFFPIGEVASKYISSAVAGSNLDFRFDKLSAGFFGAEMTNIKTGKLTINKVKLDYNPIGLIFKRFSFYAESPLFIAKGNMAGNKITADITGSVNELAALADYKGSGSLNIKGGYDLAAKEGDVVVSGGAVSFAHPMMNVEADSVNANASIKGNVITINEINASGKTSIDGKGSVVLNPKKIEFSTLDIQGKAGLMGMNMNFKLQGPASSPRFVTQ